jgi:HemY protein
VSEHWLPASPVSGRLDALEWRVPITGIVSTAPVIEPEPPPVAVTPIAGPTQELHDSEFTPPLPAAHAEIAPSSNPAPPKSAPVIPLVHAPDDPGPEVVEESAAPVEEQSGGWRKLFE